MASCGHVYVLHVKFIDPPKEKLLVPAYVLPDGRVRMFVIGTNRTDFQKSREDISKHVLPLLKSQHNGFLTHDSWLACHEVIAGWTVDEIAAMNGCYRGPLDPSVIGQVRAVIGDSKLFSEREKSLILAQWP